MAEVKAYTVAEVEELRHTVLSATEQELIATLDLERKRADEAEKERERIRLMLHERAAERDVIASERDTAEAALREAVGHMATVAPVLRKVRSRYAWRNGFIAWCRNRDRHSGGGLSRDWYAGYDFAAAMGEACPNDAHANCIHRPEDLYEDKHAKDIDAFLAKHRKGQPLPAKQGTPAACPTCGSTFWAMREWLVKPGTKDGDAVGRVTACPDAFHDRTTPEETP